MQDLFLRCFLKFWAIFKLIFFSYFCFSSTHMLNTYHEHLCQEEFKGGMVNTKHL